MAKWFYTIDGQQDGPVDPSVLKQLANSGRLKPTDKVRREEMSEWYEAKQVKGLFTTVQPPPTSAAPSNTMAAAHDRPGGPSQPIVHAKRHGEVSKLPAANHTAAPTISTAATTAKENVQPDATAHEKKKIKKRFKVLGGLCLLFLVVPAINAAREAARRNSGSASPIVTESVAGAGQPNHRNRGTSPNAITVNTSKLSEEARKYFEDSEGIAFTLDSIDETIRWGNSRSKQIRLAGQSGNQLVATEVRNAIKEEMERLKQAKVLWELRVTEVTNTQVEFDSDKSADRFQMATVNPYGALVPPLLQFDKNNIDRARKLTKDSTVMVSANVVDLTVVGRDEGQPEGHEYIRVTLSNLAFAHDQEGLRRRNDIPDSTTASVKPASALTVDQFRSRIIGRDFAPKSSFYDEYGKPARTTTVGRDTWLIYSCSDGGANVKCPSGPFQYQDDIAPVAVDQIR